MHTKDELIEKRARVWEEAKHFLDTHGDELTGLLSAEDDATYARMEETLDAYSRDIERLERAEARERELARPVTSPHLIDVASSDVCVSDYAHDFWAVMKNRAHIAPVTAALREGADAEGGYLVPDEFEAKIVDLLQEQNVMRGLATTIQTSSGDRKIPVVATHGSATWLDEGASMQESADTFKQVSISAYKLGTFLKVSEELLQDSAFDLESYLALEFARRIGAAEEEAFLVGNGTGKPTGIFTSASVGITTAKADAIAADELIDAYYALRAPYRTRATWLMNDATVKAIRKLKDAQGQYLWQPALSAGEPDTLLNRPVVTSAFAPTLSAGTTSLVFGDTSSYWIADRTTRSFKRLNELFATSGQVGFLASERVDGRLIVEDAVVSVKQKSA